MPRIARATAGGLCYHVLNRGNGRARVFHKDDDYQAFIDLIAAASDRLPMRVLGYCLMPNHFHLMLRPRGDGDISTWMQWLMTSHVRRYHAHHHSSGHIWQGRFKSFIVQTDEHFLKAMRYVERNALRAGLVKRAEDWRFGSLYWRTSGRRLGLLADWPVQRPSRWRQMVNRPQNEAELEALRRCVQRGRPYGNDRWVRRVARRHDLETTLRPRGRPKGHS
ncbi:MAG: transposase [Planctomycetes bacterium]|nr:transposase [Planctomycetota bacterium]